jgi:hypothetical protein
MEMLIKSNKGNSINDQNIDDIASDKMRVIE